MNLPTYWTAVALDLPDVSPIWIVPAASAELAKQMMMSLGPADWLIKPFLHPEGPFNLTDYARSVNGGV